MLRELAPARHARHRLAAEPRGTTPSLPSPPPIPPPPQTAAKQQATLWEPALRAHSAGIGDQSKSGGASSKSTSRGPRQCAVWLMRRNLRRDKTQQTRTSDEEVLQTWIGLGGGVDEEGRGEGQPCDNASTRLPGTRWLEFQKPDIEVL